MKPVAACFGRALLPQKKGSRAVESQVRGSLSMAARYTLVYFFTSLSILILLQKLS